MIGDRPADPRQRPGDDDPEQAAPLADRSPRGRGCALSRGDEAQSAVEHRPAEMVAAPLIVEDELAHRFWQLVPLPQTFLLSRGVCARRRSRGNRRLDRVRSRAEAMFSDMSDDRSLTSCKGSMSRRPAQFAGRGHRVPARSACLHHPCLATRPGADLFDRLSRSPVLWPSRLEQLQNVLGAGRRPQSEQVVVLIGQRPATTDRHEPWISDLREDHEDIVLVILEASGASAARCGVPDVLARPNR